MRSSAALLLALGVSPLFLAPLFLLQPRLGDQTIAWRDRWRAWRLTNRVRTARAAERKTLQSLSAAVVGGYRHLTATTPA